LELIFEYLSSNLDEMSKFMDVALEHYHELTSSIKTTKYELI